MVGSSLHPDVCPQVGNLKAHLKIHIADGPLKCRECGKQFTTSGSRGWGAPRAECPLAMGDREGFKPHTLGLLLKGADLWDRGVPPISPSHCGVPAACGTGRDVGMLRCPRAAV